MSRGMDNVLLTFGWASLVALYLLDVHHIITL